MPSNSAENTLTVADILSARNEYHRKKRGSDAQTRATRWHWKVLPFLGIATLGSMLGLSLPPGRNLEGFSGRVSNGLGWTYFFFWAVAEYPPLKLNRTRKAVGIDSLDQIVYYFGGDASYTAFTGILHWSKTCRTDRNKVGLDKLRNRLSRREGCRGRADSIHLNDALFSIHSTACTLILLGQLLAYSPRRVQLSLQCWVVVVSVLVIGGGGLVLALQDSSYLTVPAYLYGISFLRLGSCVTKQMPSSPEALPGRVGQERESHLAAQWALLAGGFLSCGQQVFDAAVSGVWSILWGNLTKLLLALLTAGFSVVVLFREHRVGCGSRRMVGRCGSGDEPSGSTGSAGIDRADALAEALLDSS